MMHGATWVLWIYLIGAGIWLIAHGRHWLRIRNDPTASIDDTEQHLKLALAAQRTLRAPLWPIPATLWVVKTMGALITDARL